MNHAIHSFRAMPLRAPRKFRFLQQSARIFMVLTILSISIVLRAGWPVDPEPYGFLGCKVLRFRGLHEENIDSSRLDESTEGTCITTAIGNVVMYYQWPPFSHFDGIYKTFEYDGIVKPVFHIWNFQLMTGTGGATDCETDDPAARTLPGNPFWTGLDEIRKLVYVAERSYGHEQEYFRIDEKACEGLGYYPIDHVLRNRFGYPSCRTIPITKPIAKKEVIQNIRQRIPVIAMKCQHVYIIDGYTKETRTGREMFHSCDYIEGVHTMGWFTWKYLLREGLTLVVVGITPDCRMPGLSRTSFKYSWGDRYIPGTSYTSRRGYIEVIHARDLPIGKIECTLSRGTPLESNIARDPPKPVYNIRSSFAARAITIPPAGTFPFEIEDDLTLVLSVSNNDASAKTLRVVFHDFTGDSVSALDIK
jgi:hypothetical protein